MENMINFINGFRPKISLRDDVAGRLKVFHNLKEVEINKSKNYFIVSELCLPVDAFIEKKFKKEKSQKLKNTLAQGNRIHSIAQNWLMQHKDYCGSEAILDGIFIGLPVRGKIDGRINEFIIEIKSIKNLPEKIQDIIDKYPQYVEQVAFYSAIDPLAPKENYLVFVKKDYPYTIKSFKLSISDAEAIKNILQKRIYLLKKILGEEEEAKILGKCRYCYEEDCSVKKEGKCHLFDLQPLKCEIEDYIKLIEDANFNSELEILKKTFGNNYELYSANNLLCPRKYCLRELYGVEEDFESKNSAAKAYFGNLIYRFRSNEGFSAKKEESRFSEFELSKYNWFNDKTSLSPEGKRTPFITHVTNYYNPDNPGSYKIAELGVYLMAYGLSRGMIFIYYPEKDQIKVFEIMFNFKGDYVSEIRNIIKGLQHPENFSSLPKCPSWMCEKCVYAEKCMEKD